MPSDNDDSYFYYSSASTSSVFYMIPSPTINEFNFGAPGGGDTVTQLEGSSGTTPFTFIITRAGDLSAANSVGYTVTGDASLPGTNAADAADFVGGVLPSGTISFAPGQASRIIAIAVAGDTQPEFNEAFTVSMSNIEGFVIFDNFIVHGIIINDDVPSPPDNAGFAIAADTPSQNEGNSGTTPFTFTITRSGTLGTDSVGWTVIGAAGHSAGQSDLAGGVAPSGRVTFAPGQTSQTITINVAGDTQVEPDEGFQVVLQGASAGTHITTGAAQAVILNDDTGLSIAADTPRQYEGNSGPTAFTFTVTRTGLLAAGDSVAWTTIGLGASTANAADFIGHAAPSGTITFAVGEASRTITLDVQGDTAVEADENFQVVLIHPSQGVTLTTSHATATILNDDTGFAIAAVDAVKPEGDSGATSLTFAVTRTGTLAGTDSVAWQTSGTQTDGATASDFVRGAPLAGTLTFAAGESSKIITLSVQGDTTAEPDEHFSVQLHNASPGATITTASASGTILNDDIVSPPADSYPTPGMAFLPGAENPPQTPAGAPDIRTVASMTEAGPLAGGQSVAEPTGSGDIPLPGAADPWAVPSPAGAGISLGFHDSYISYM